MAAQAPDLIRYVEIIKLTRRRQTDTVMGGRAGLKSAQNNVILTHGKETAPGAYSFAGRYNRVTGHGMRILIRSPDTPQDLCVYRLQKRLIITARLIITPDHHA